MFEKFFGKKDEPAEVTEGESVSPEASEEQLKDWQVNTLKEIVRLRPELKGMSYLDAYNENLRLVLIEKHGLPVDTSLKEAKRVDLEKAGSER